MKTKIDIKVSRTKSRNEDHDVVVEGDPQTELRKFHCQTEERLHKLIGSLKADNDLLHKRIHGLMCENIQMRNMGKDSDNESCDEQLEKDLGALLDVPLGRVIYDNIVLKHKLNGQQNSCESDDDSSDSDSDSTLSDSQPLGSSKGSL